MQPNLFKTTQPMFVFSESAAPIAGLERLVTGGRAALAAEREVLLLPSARVGEHVDLAATHAAGPLQHIGDRAALGAVPRLSSSSLASVATREDLIAQRVNLANRTSREATSEVCVDSETTTRRIAQWKAARAATSAPAPAPVGANDTRTSEAECLASARMEVAPSSEPAASPASSPARKLSAQSPLFRAEALAAYARGERVASVLRITTVSRWTLLSVLGGALLVALGVISFAKVEERSAARGVLRMPFGVQPVLPLIGGQVREVLAAQGAQVSAGQVLVRLDTTPIEAERGEAQERLAALEEQWRLQRQSLQTRFLRSEALTRTRIGLLEARQRGQQRRIVRHNEQVSRVEAPELTSVIERTVRDRTAEALDGARDDLLRMQDETSALRLQLASSRGEYEQQLAAGEQHIREARAKLDASNMLLQQTELRAPIAGRLESLRAQAGQTVQAGEWIARVVRDGSPQTIVAFVPERDAAFLRVGAQARVEIDKLPAGEFGLARAHIERVGAELADAAELTAALGEGVLTGPHVRVELTLDDAPETERVRQFLRAGTLVTARIALRDRRLLAIVFEPFRKWLK